MKWPLVQFDTLYAEPSRNGLNRPTRVRGAGFKMVNMGELFAYDRIADQDMELVPMDDRELKEYTLLEGDLLFARQSLVLEGAGKCSIVKSVNEPTSFEGHLIRVRLDQNLCNPNFYFYYFRSSLSPIFSIVQQCAQAGIKASDLAKLQVVSPSLDTQNKTAAILSAYDDLIENNRRRMTLLEESARQLYREWFVRLRFPGYEHTRIVRGVPEGWDIRNLQSVCVEENGIQTGPFGSQLHQSDYSEDGVPVVMPKNMVNFKIAIEEIARVPESIAEKLSRHRMQLCDIVYGRRGDIGRRAFISRRQVGWLCGSGSMRIRANPHIVNPRYLFETLGSPETAGTIANRAKGSTMLNLSATIMQSIPVLVASHNLQNLYAEQVEPMYELIETLSEQNEKLRAARDLLLPRLLSGQIAV